MKEKLKKLINVKTIVTFALVAVWSVLVLRETTIPTEVTTIVMTVIAFYFGTQIEKNSKEDK